MYILGGLKTNMSHLQVENIWGGISIGSVLNSSENLHSILNQYLRECYRLEEWIFYNYSLYDPIRGFNSIVDMDKILLLLDEWD